MGNYLCMLFIIPMQFMGNIIKFSCGNYKMRIKLKLVYICINLIYCNRDHIGHRSSRCHHRPARRHVSPPSRPPTHYAHMPRGRIALRGNAHRMAPQRPTHKHIRHRSGVAPPSNRRRSLGIQSAHHGGRRRRLLVFRASSGRHRR